MPENDHAPEFKAKLRQKDLRFVQETARELKQGLPGAPLAFPLITMRGAATASGIRQCM